MKKQTEKKIYEKPCTKKHEPQKFIAGSGDSGGPTLYVTYYY